MRMHRAVMYRAVPGILLSIGCGMVATSAADAQEYRGTMAQQMACTSDVFRLCGQQIPDTNRIVACLRQNTPQLSGPCRAVFESNASMPSPSAPRVHTARAPVTAAQPPANEFQSSGSGEFRSNNQFQSNDNEFRSNENFRSNGNSDF